jgi:membrane peptidoglycan carboxypeptidase
VSSRMGVAHAATTILSVTDSSGKVIEQYHQPDGQQVLDPGYAYEITSILSDDHAGAMEFGPHSVLQLGRPAAAKTGTTDDFRANWTIGYTPAPACACPGAGDSTHCERPVPSRPDRGRQAARGLLLDRTAAGAQPRPACG